MTILAGTTMASFVSPVSIQWRSSSKVSRRPRHGTFYCAVRDDFPILTQNVHERPLIYLDSAATSQKPRTVLDALNEFYTTNNASIHRGACAHELSQNAATVVEQGRQDVADFIGADPSEISFTRNATEGINAVAYGWAAYNLKKGDEILLTVMEHHSNLVPWQIIAKRTGAKLKFVPLDKSGGFSFDGFVQAISRKTKLIALTHVSNVLGCINPVKFVCEMTQGRNIKVLVDACQSVPHMPVDVKQLDCDWLVASGHKMFATGVGVLYTNSRVEEEMHPFIGGDGVLHHYEGGGHKVTRKDVEQMPSRMEAGALPLAEIAGLSAAIRYLKKIGMEEVHRQEQKLAQHLRLRLSEFKEINVYGPGPGEERAALCAFNVEGVHPTDLATMLDLEGIAIRSGHHCAQPLHRELGVESSARASLHIYNTTEEIDRFIESLQQTVELLGVSLTTNKAAPVSV